VEDSKKDIVTDFRSILRKYGEAGKESDRIFALKANLDARKKCFRSTIRRALKNLLGKAAMKATLAANE